MHKQEDSDFERMRDQLAILEAAKAALADTLAQLSVVRARCAYLRAYVRGQHRRRLGMQRVRVDWRVQRSKGQPPRPQVLRRVAN